jgi:hypothetical protein
MTSLLSLPTELIIHISALCPTAQTATCLSAVNKELRAIWLKHTREILESIVRLRVPAYEEATALAKMQCSLLPDDELADAAQLPSVDQAPLILHHALLFRNASLASSAIAAWKAHLIFLPATNWRYSCQFPDKHRSYYLIRMLVAVYRCLDEQQELLRAYHSLLKATQTDRLVTLDELCTFLHEVRHQGLHITMKDEKDRDTDELTDGSWTPGWDYAAKVVRAAVYERTDVTYMLEDMIFNPQEWWPYELIMRHSRAVAARGHGAPGLY